MALLNESTSLLLSKWKRGPFDQFVMWLAPITSLLLRSMVITRLSYFCVSESDPPWEVAAIIFDIRSLARDELFSFS